MPELLCDLGVSMQRPMALVHGFSIAVEATARHCWTVGPLSLGLLDTQNLHCDADCHYEQAGNEHPVGL